MMRRADWLPRMRQAMVDMGRRRFVWGGHDCCLAACNLARAYCDDDPGKRFRNRYTTKRGASLVLRSEVGRDAPADRLVELVAAKIADEFGRPEVPPLRAQRGDFVVALAEIDGAMRQVLAIIDLSGRHAITAHQQGGWGVLPLANVVRAWRV